MLEYVFLPPSPSVSFIPLKSTNQSSPLLAPLCFSTALTYLYSFSLPPAASLMGSGLLAPDPFLTPLSFLLKCNFFCPLLISPATGLSLRSVRKETLPVSVQSAPCYIILLLALCRVTSPLQPIPFTTRAGTLRGCSQKDDISPMQHWDLVMSKCCPLLPVTALCITVFWQRSGAWDVRWGCTAVPVLSRAHLWQVWRKPRLGMATGPAPARALPSLRLRRSARGDTGLAGAGTRRKGCASWTGAEGTGR